jgi:hypothetical protein
MNISDGIPWKNRLIIKNSKTGKILVDTTNLVVQYGRLFVMEKIFGSIPNDQPTSHSDNLSKTINLFGIGTGGSLPGDYFEPLLPTPSDTDITKIPFRDVSSQLSQDDANLYAAPVLESNRYKYRYKKITSTTWNVDLTNNRISLLIFCRISNNDARSSIINEIGFYSSTSSNDHPVLFSRITFDSRKLIDADELDVHYEIFI